MTHPYLFFKSFADRFVAVLALVILLPLLVLTALSVRCFLGSPVIFCQSRPGFRGKSFTLLKFRTMSDIRDVDGQMLPDSRRLTSFGRWLRSFSIDELPSLVNIARGNMSFVGPRPFVIPVSEYESIYLRRFKVLPGLTGWAQINGRNSISWEKKFQLDCFYVDNVSFLLDCSILLRTLTVLFDTRLVSAEGHSTAPKYKP